MSLFETGHWSHCNDEDEAGACGRSNGCLATSNHISVCVLGQVHSYLLAAVDKTRLNKIGDLFAPKLFFQQHCLQFISIACSLSLRESM